MSIPLLLTSPSSHLRLLVLKNLMGKDSNDHEVKELVKLAGKDKIITDILQMQNEDGSFRTDTITATGSILQATSIALVKLGFLGFSFNDLPVYKAAEFLMNSQGKDGGWKLEIANDEEGNYDMVPLQTAFPLLGLAAVGLCKHKLAEKGYEWLLTKQLKDGAWPTGTASGNYGYVAKYRKLENSQFGCRSNTTCALLAFSYHPGYIKNKNMELALNHILENQKFERHNFGFNLARLINIEPSQGYFTYFAQNDVLLSYTLIKRFKINEKESKVAKILDFVNSLKNPVGLWEYINNPMVNHWLTYYILSVSM